MKSEPAPFRIAKPCPKKWDDMSGDAKRRFCEHCQLHVHNLSAMSGREREELVAKSEGRLCIAYELRGDGSMVTPSRWSWLFLPLRRIQQAAAALLAACLPMVFSACATREVLGDAAPSTKERKLLGEAPTKASAETSTDENPDHLMVGMIAPRDPEKKP